MNTRQELIGLVDLDGSCADYDGAMRRDMLKIATPGEDIEWYGENVPQYLRERKKMIQDQPGWWRNLDVLPIGMALVQIMQELEYSLMVLTKGPTKRNPAAWSEKVEWCKEKLPEVPVTITADKGLVYGKVLVDDFPEYATRWLEWRPRGQVIMPKQPWTEGFQHPNVFRCGMDDLDEARRILTEIKTRTLA